MKESIKSSLSPGPGPALDSSGKKRCGDIRRSSLKKLNMSQQLLYKMFSYQLNVKPNLKTFPRKSVLPQNIRLTITKLSSYPTLAPSC